MQSRSDKNIYYKQHKHNLVFVWKTLKMFLPLSILFFKSIFAIRFFSFCIEIS